MVELDDGKKKESGGRKKNGEEVSGKEGKKKRMGGGIAMECAFIQQIFHFLFHLDTVQLRSQQKEVFRLFAANYSISD